MQLDMPNIEVTRLPNATVFHAADLGIRTAEVVRKGDRWEACCYYGPEEYDTTRPTERTTAERVALAHSFSFRGGLVGPRRTAGFAQETPSTLPGRWEGARA